MDIQFSPEPLEILKWVGLVFIAGFIGYFGRYLSMMMIDRLRKRKAETTPANTEPHKEPATVGAAEAEKNKLKLEKKKLKLEKKRAKKGE